MSEMADYPSGENMKRNFFVGIAMALLLAAAPAMADEPDSSMWLRGDYVGVGGIDMPKLAQRRIYGYLMNFFVTDSGAKQALEEIKSAGIILEKILTRVVVGIPSDVERSEHIVLWETTEDLSKYKTLLSAHSQIIDTRTYQGIEYFATRRENECLAIFDTVLVLGSELRVREIIDARKAGYKDGPKNSALKAEMKAVDKKKDAWFVFALTDKEKKQLLKTDPIIDMSAGGLGVLKLSEMQKGRMWFDFSKGLGVQADVTVSSSEIAAQDAKILNAVLVQAGQDQDVKDLGFDSFMTGVEFKSDKSSVKISVAYDQSKFDELISIVTQFMKSISSTKP